MTKSCARSGLLAAFVCWLVILPRSDDFNFARAVLPSTPASEDLLPLDDPNTDFTQSSQSPEPTTTHRPRCSGPSAGSHSSPGAALPSPLAAPPPRQSSNVPLHC
jgi:hypothetical protein